MKVTAIKWAFMTNTLVFPVLTAGKIVRMTAYMKGEGRWDGRFPVAYAIATDDAVVEQKRVSRADEKASPTPGRVFQKDTHPTLFTREEKAFSVARKWAAEPREGGNA